jgi:signal transduction histidine kinase
MIETAQVRKPFVIKPWSELQMETIDASSVASRLQQMSVFADASVDDLGRLGEVQLMHLEIGDAAEQTAENRGFFALLEGKVKIKALNADMVPLLYQAGETFGEIPILANKKPTHVSIALEPTLVVRFSEEKFWKLMFACPTVRGQILGNMARRLETYQAQEMQREKLTSLGTLSAGLMHELKNPGTAAIRAASQMREKLQRLQQLSLKFSRKPKNAEQMECLGRLQEMALGAQCCRPMGSLEQADAEQAMEEQLDASGVENSWQLAPTLVSMSMTSHDLECAKAVFSGEELSDSLTWVVSLMSSMQLVGTIEESLGRVNDLIMAVKHYSYEDESGQPSVDVHASLQSTLLILNHKLRQKQITVEREFAPNLPTLHLRGSGLHQVWTNLIDNAIDASPDGGVILVKTAQDGDFIQVSVEDHGTGITPENAPRVFEPFFTTKEVGVGSGLGLDIVHRILAMKLGGTVTFDSTPGHTVFTVRLPIDWQAESAKS